MNECLDENNKNSDSTLPLYSYHTFLFPFRWDCSNRNNIRSINDVSYEDRLNIHGFYNALDKKKWQHDAFEIKQPKDYNEYVYFYKYVRDAIYNTEGSQDELESNKTTYFFKYDLPDDPENEYNFYNIYIKRNKKDCKLPKHYQLSIDSIALKVYDTGVAILQFNLKNHKYAFPKAILEINEFGRRVYPQFLGDFSGKDKNYRGVNATKNSFFPDRIEIRTQSSGSKNDKPSDYYDNIDNLIVSQNQDPTEIPDFISSLLGDKFKNKFIEDGKGLCKGDVFINPIIDDRMFVICSYSNKRCVPTEETFKKSSFWYKYLFIDGKFKGCASEKMEKNLLQEHSYIRWIGLGAIHGISRYSFMFLSSGNNLTGNLTLLHNKTMYYQIVLLVLAQRASILRFSNEVANISRLKKKVVDRVSELYKNYIQFVNKIYFREVTAQEQGIEIYDMLLKHMRIKEDIKDLDGEISELHSYANLISEKKTNHMLTLISIFGVLFLLPTFITSFFGMNIFPEAFFKCYDGNMLEWMQNTYMEKVIYYFLASFTTVGILWLIIKVIKGIINFVKNRIRSK